MQESLSQRAHQGHQLAARYRAAFSFVSAQRHRRASHKDDPLRAHSLALEWGAGQSRQPESARAQDAGVLAGAFAGQVDIAARWLEWVLGLGLESRAARLSGLEAIAAGFVLYAADFAVPLEINLQLELSQEPEA